jgi:flagellar hook assembly protein FlgD
LANSISQEKLSFKIYNILGQVVRSFEPNNLTHDREFEFAWNGISNEGLVVPSGVYFFVMEGSGFRKSLKLLLLK